MKNIGANDYSRVPINFGKKRTLVRKIQNRRPMGSFLSALLIALLVAPPAGHGAGNSVSSGKPGSFTVTKNTQTTLLGSGNFSHIVAYSFDNKDNPATDRQDVGGAAAVYTNSGPYTTRATSRAGAKWTAAATTTAAVTKLTATSVTWTANGTTFSVTKTGTGVVPEEALAFWSVRDPVSSPVVPGDVFDISYVPDGEWNFSFASGTNDYIGVCIATGSTGTSLSGLTNILNWTVSVSTTNPGVVSVMVTRMGTNDSTTAAQIISRFSYDPGTLSYSFDAAGFSLDQPFSVPADFTGTNVDITMEYTGECDVFERTAVPALPKEGRITLMLLFLAIGIACINKMRFACVRH